MKCRSRCLLQSLQESLFRGSGGSGGPESALEPGGNASKAGADGNRLTHSKNYEVLPILFSVILLEKRVPALSLSMLM